MSRGADIFNVGSRLLITSRTKKFPRKIKSAVYDANTRTIRRKRLIKMGIREKEVSWKFAGLVSIGRDTGNTWCDLGATL